MMTTFRRFFFISKILFTAFLRRIGVIIRRMVRAVFAVESTLGKLGLKVEG